METTLRNDLKKIIYSTNKESGYFLSKAILEENFASLSSICHDQVKMLFPVKSCHHIEVLKLAAKYFDGFDISNQQEANHIKALSSKKMIVWNSSPYAQEKIQGISSHYIYDCNSKGTFSHKSNQSLRLSSEIFFPYFKSRFGVSYPDLIDLMKKYKTINSIHIHFGSQYNKCSDYISILDTLLGFESISENIHLNIGGGQIDFSLSDYQKIIDLFLNIYPRGTIFFEPGRSIFNNAMIAVGTVLEVVKRNDYEYLITNLSIESHLKWSTPQILKPIRLQSKKEKRKQLLTGPTCSEQDQYALTFDANLERGDRFLIGPISGYSLEWNHVFNGVSELPLIIY